LVLQTLFPSLGCQWPE